MRRHVQNLSDGRFATWRYGRGWLGRWHAEWFAFKPSGLLSISVWWFGFSIYLRWFGLYMSFGEKGRDWSVSWHDGCLWLDHPWVREMEWRSDDLWWKKTIVLHVVEWLIGRSRCETVKGSPSETFIPMPEGCYRATATPETRTWRRRWYWPERRRDSVWLDIPGGIPRNGKGDNSWDCGDDGLFGCGGDTLEDAIAHAVRSSLRDRRRYGHDSKGTGREPVIVLNGVKEPQP